ncbi:MAG: hypothetical protein KJ574_03045 [Nanoarchaeota archaeon]|nr:hypothetical protein [Nanoarchaeota archaeon]
MDIKDVVNKLESSEVFKDWRKDHSKAYLAHVFFMADDEGYSSFDVGYYMKEEDRLASFGVNGSIEFKGVSEAFKHPDQKIKKLDLSEVKITPEDALNKAKELQESQYKQSKPFKQIIILQHIDLGQLWNITYVTQNFKTLNIKIDAKTGEIKEHKLLDLIQKQL